MSGGDWGHPYTQQERILGYGTENDPRLKKPDPQPPAPEGYRGVFPPPAPARLDPKAQEIAARLQSLVGQRLIAVKVVPLGVIFEFENAVYWAYGGPVPHV